MSYDTKPSVDIEALHEAIKTTIKARYVKWTVDYYGRPGEQQNTPAILFELDSIEPGDAAWDVGTGQANVVLRFSAYVIRKFGEGNKSKLLVRKATADFCAFLLNQTWGQAVGVAEFIGADPDTFDGNPKEYEVMRVDWQHDALIGTDEWIDEGDDFETVEVSDNGGPYTQVEPAV